MGLTVACARCHDHKYDPISAADYYALYGVFASSQEKPRDDAPPELVDAATPYDPYVFLRGNPGNRGPERRAAFPHDASRRTTSRARSKHGSGRREMAEAIASRDNPLTARVWVNRVWGHLFGAVPRRHAERFRRPRHAADASRAARLRWPASSWTTAGRPSGSFAASCFRARTASRATRAPSASRSIRRTDLLWRANRRRLDLESLRDSLLVAAGRLDETMGGPSVSLTDAPFSTRRSVYGFIERQNLPAFFRTFDFANPNTHTPERPQTTSPQQALFLMNSPFAIEQATYLAARSERRGGWGRAAGEPPDAARDAANRVRRINRLFRFALGREPTLDELTDALEFVDRGDPAAVANDRQPARLAVRLGHVRRAGPHRPIPTAAALRQQTPGKAAAKLPDPALGWAMLNATGGHPGDAGHAAIRRWTAPPPATLHIEGVLVAPGRQAATASAAASSPAAAGVVGSWDVFHSEAATNAAADRRRSRRHDRLRHRLAARTSTPTHSTGP